MNEIDETLSRANYREIIYYLLYYGERKAKDFPKPLPLGERDDLSFENFINKMHGICPKITPHDNDILDIMLEFAEEQREIFMELGFIAGFEIYQQLTQERNNLL